jgi:uncharacterized protein with HEPN domain
LTDVTGFGLQKEPAEIYREAISRLKQHEADLKRLGVAIERIHARAGGSLGVFESDWQRQWLVERGVEIVSEASGRLTDELIVRHPEIPWQKVAGIGNVLRHDYESIAAPVMWKLAQADLPALEKVCREELAAELARKKWD